MTTLKTKIGVALLALAASAPLARAAEPVKYTADDGWVLGEIVKNKHGTYDRTSLPTQRTLVPGETFAQAYFRHRSARPENISDAWWGAVLSFGGISFPKEHGLATYFVDLTCNNNPGDSTGSSNTLTKGLPLSGRAILPLNCPLMPPWVAQPKQNIELRVTAVDEKTGAATFEMAILPMYVEAPSVR